MPTDEPEVRRTREGLQACPVCKSKHTFFHETADGTFKVGWCAACGAAFDYVRSFWERILESV